MPLKLKTLTLLIIMTAAMFSWMRPASALDGVYKDGLFIQSDDGKNSLKTNLFLQFQHQFLSVEGQGKTNSFQIRRGRLLFSGTALTQSLSYMFHFEFVGGRTNNPAEGVAFTGPNLLDGYIDYAWMPAFQIKAGQFKVPYNLEELVADQKSGFIDRPITNDVFSFTRDMGVAFHGRPWGRLFDYTLYVMNEGNNRNVSNKNNEMLLGGRFVFNVLGDAGTTTGDPDLTEEPQLMLGLATNFNHVGTVAGADQSVISTTGDALFRYRGISVLAAGYYLRNQTASTNTFGFVGQGGYFVIPHHLEVMARFCGVVPTAAGVTNGFEAGGGLSYYFMGHKLKLTTDYAVLINSPLVVSVSTAVPPVAAVNGPASISTTGGVPGFVQNQNDHRVRTQLQLFF